MNQLNKYRTTCAEVTAEVDSDAVLVSFLPNIRWATGFSGSNGLLITRGDSVSLVTDGRYKDQASAEVPEDVAVYIAENGLMACVDEHGLLAECKQVAFQSDHVTVQQHAAWSDRHPELTFVPAAGMFTEGQGVKSVEEVEAIRSAQRVTDSVFSELVAWIEPGLTEREVAAEIVYRHIKRGADKMSFDPIVASGPNGALPHARPTDRVLERGDLVVIDMGCFMNGYASDMTRTLAIGDPGNEARDAYAAVQNAQSAALQAAHAGMEAKDLDATARDVLEKAGYGPYFSHSLGHGVGLQIHEWPRVSKNSDATLPDGAVVTIEPGVYLPGKLGVRIEDIIVLREGGVENLTTSPKSLILIGD